MQHQNAPLKRSLFYHRTAAPGIAAAAAPAGNVADTLQHPQRQQHVGRATLLSQLAAVAVVVTSTGQLQLTSAGSNSASSSSDGATCDSTLYLPHQLGNALDLQATFPGFSWTVISPAYANVCPAVVTADKWCQLFQALGVQQFLPVQQISHQLTWQQLLTDAKLQHWKKAAEQLANDAVYVIQDWDITGFDRLLSGILSEQDAGRKQKQLCALGSVMAQSWPQLKDARQLEAMYNITTVEHTSSSCSASQHVGSSRKSSSSSLSAAAASWRPGSNSLPSSLLLQLQRPAWLLA